MASLVNGCLFRLVCGAPIGICRWNLGSGDQILFWEDSWVGEGIALKDKYPDLYQVTSQKLKTVASMGIFGEHG